MRERGSLFGIAVCNMGNEVDEVAELDGTASSIRIGVFGGCAEDSPILIPLIGEVALIGVWIATDLVL